MIFRRSLLWRSQKRDIKKLVETAFYFQTKGLKVAKKQFLLAVMWVASSCVKRVVSDFGVIKKNDVSDFNVIKERNHFLSSLRPYTFRITSALTICTACNLHFILYQWFVLDLIILAYSISFATVCLFFHIN